MPASPDWSAAHRRLNDLGAKCFHVDQLPNGDCRVICLLPTTEQGKTHRVEAQAGSEAAALALALERVETWARRR